MNIFYLDKDPIIAAQQHCDKHVVKMIVEYAQMLSTAHRILDGNLIHVPVLCENGYQILKKNSEPKTKKHYEHSNPVLDENLYKAAHINHPSTIWARTSNNNYNWLYYLFCCLCNEYTHRYNKVHSTEIKLGSILGRVPNNIEVGYKTPIPLAMNSQPQCKNENDRVGSYRAFYMTKQHDFKMAWSNRPVPEWFVFENEV